MEYTPEQRLAIDTIDRNLQIIACAGSGKTSVVTARVITLFRERGVPTLDVAELVKDVPVEDRIASPVDPHPSELVHELVAEAVYQLLLENGWGEP